MVVRPYPTPWKLSLFFSVSLFYSNRGVLFFKLTGERENNSARNWTFQVKATLFPPISGKETSFLWALPFLYVKCSSEEDMAIMVGRMCVCVCLEVEVGSWTAGLISGVALVYSSLEWGLGFPCASCLRLCECYWKKVLYTCFLNGDVLSRPLYPYLTLARFSMQRGQAPEPLH